MALEKTKVYGGLGLGIVGGSLFFLLAFLNVTAQGWLAGLMLLVWTLLFAIATSIIISLATMKKEGWLVYAGTIFTAVILYEIVRTLMQMFIPIFG